MQQADSVVDPTRAIVEAQANLLREDLPALDTSTTVVRGEQFQMRCSCRQNFIDRMKFLIHTAGSETVLATSSLSASR